MVKKSFFYLVLVLFLVANNFKNVKLFDIKSFEKYEEFSYSFNNLCSPKSIAENKTFNSYYKLDFKMPLIEDPLCQLFDSFVDGSAKLKDFKKEIFNFFDDGLKNRSDILLSMIDQMYEKIRSEYIYNRDNIPYDFYIGFCAKCLKQTINGLIKLKNGYLSEDLMEPDKFIGFLTRLEPLNKEVKSVFKNEPFRIFYSKPFVYSLGLDYVDFELTELNSGKIEILKFSVFMPMINSTHRINSDNCRSLELPDNIMNELKIKDLADNFENKIEEADEKSDD